MNVGETRLVCKYKKSKIKNQLRSSSVVNLTAFFGGTSDMLFRGEGRGEFRRDVGAENDLLCGRKRAMRSLIPAKGLGELDEGAAEVTVVVEADALENGVQTMGLPEEEVIVVDGFLSEERVGGGGKLIGEDRLES